MGEAGYDGAANFLDKFDHIFRTGHLPNVVKLALSRVPDEWLLTRAKPIRFFEVTDIAQAWFCRAGADAGTDFVFLDRRAADLPPEQLAAVIAHELGHIYVRDKTGKPTPQNTAGEKDADAWAVKWGFGIRLLEHLRSELKDPTLRSDIRAQLTEREEAVAAAVENTST